MPNTMTQVGGSLLVVPSSSLLLPLALSLVGGVGVGVAVGVVAVVAVVGD